MQKSKFMTLLVVSFCLMLAFVGKAQANSFELRYTIERTEDLIRIQRDLQLSRTKDNEIIRGQDLNRNVQDSMQRTRDMMRTMKDRMQSLKSTSNDMYEARMRMVQDAIDRNKRQLDFNRQLQQERLQRLREQNAAFRQKLRDMQI